MWLGRSDLSMRNSALDMNKRNDQRPNSTSHVSCAGLLKPHERLRVCVYALCSVLSALWLSSHKRKTGRGSSLHKTRRLLDHFQEFYVKYEIFRFEVLQSSALKSTFVVVELHGVHARGGVVVNHNYQASPPVKIRHANHLDARAAGNRSCCLVVSLEQSLSHLIYVTFELLYHLRIRTLSIR